MTANVKVTRLNHGLMGETIGVLFKFLVLLIFRAATVVSNHTQIKTNKGQNNV